MDTKPIITYYAGNTSVVDKLKEKIMINLPEDWVEWQRSYGRSSKRVFLEANIVPFKETYLKSSPFLEANSQHFNSSDCPSFLGQCLLHTYWFECSDLDFYKSKIREDVISWMNKLREYEVWDWLVVVVESTERKKTNKTKLLNRTTIADKVRSDFPSSVKDASDRCISLLNPLKNEASAQDSYDFFLDRLRVLLLRSFSRHLSKYEDFVRTRREKRNFKDWDFFKFFILQEELAFAFEMLSLYEDALVQYDELDALFSQFVINSHVMQPPNWLKALIERSQFWNGLTLCKEIQTELREKIRDSTASLLDLRNYLFSRQCDLHFVQHKPWDLATRALPFLQNCVNELNILEVDFPPGAVACWVFLSALEILMKCERFNDSTQMQFYSRYTVGLWAYARKKLEELGTLCGLTPGMRHDSKSLHKVVNLISGMGRDPYPDGQMSPQLRLKEALSTPDSFLKAFLEISELTISTFKHIGHFRSARLIGRELAFLYMRMNSPQQAIPFFLDIEKVFLQERWIPLLTDTRKNLYECYSILKDEKKVLQYSLLLAANKCVNDELCKRYMNYSLLMRNSIKELCLLPMEELVRVETLSIKTQGVFVTNSSIELTINLKSNFPEAIPLQSALVYINYEPLTPKPKIKSEKSYRDHNLCPHSASHAKDKNISAKPRFETYHTAVEVGVKCPNLNRCFRRSEGAPNATIDMVTNKGKNSPYFKVENVVLNPGLNELVLSFEPTEYGCYTAEEIQLNISDRVGLVHKPLANHLCFSVISEEPNLKVLPSHCDENLPNIELLSGPPQKVVVRLNSGSYTFSPESLLVLKSSFDLCVRLDNQNFPFTKTIDIVLDKTLEPFQNYDINLVIKCKFSSQRGPTGSEHNITLLFAENKKDKVKSVKKTLYFIPPFMSTLRLFTNNTRKFIKITIKAISSQRLELFDANLSSVEAKNHLSIKSMNPPSRMALLKDQAVHYLWEVDQSEEEVTKFLFMLKYNLTGEITADPLNYYSYDCDFKLNDYRTFYAIRVSVDPSKGSEFCRVGAVCKLKISIEKVGSETTPCSIMYEVISDNNLWNISGRTAGIIENDSQNKYNLVFDILPLTSGRLPVPSVRLSKYVYSYLEGSLGNTDGSSKDNLPTSEENSRKEAKLVAFESGQIYNWSRSAQTNVLPSSGLILS